MAVEEPFLRCAEQILNVDFEQVEVLLYAAEFQGVSLRATDPPKQWSSTSLWNVKTLRVHRLILSLSRPQQKRRRIKSHFVICLHAFPEGPKTRRSETCFTLNNPFQKILSSGRGPGEQNSYQ